MDLDSAYGPYGFPSQEIWASAFGRCISLTDPLRSVGQALTNINIGSPIVDRSGKLTYSKVETMSDLEEAVTASLGYSVEIKAGGSDSYELSTQFSTKMNSKTVVVRATSSFTEKVPIDVYKQPVLTEEAAELLASKGPQVFQDRYGDGFVTCIGKMGSYTALFSFSSNSFELHNEVKVKVENKFDVAIGSAKTTGELKNNLNLKDSSVEIKIDKIIVGAPGSGTEAATAFAALSNPMTGSPEDIDIIRKEAAFALARFPGEAKFMYVHPFNVLDSYKTALAKYNGSEKARAAGASETLMKDVTRAFVVYAHVITVGKQGLKRASLEAEDAKLQLERTMKDSAKAAKMSFYRENMRGYPTAPPAGVDGKTATPEDWAEGRALYEKLVYPKPMDLMFMLLKDKYRALQSDAPAAPAVIKLGDRGLSVHLAAFSGGGSLDLGTWFMDYQEQKVEMGTGLNIAVLEPVYNSDGDLLGISPDSSMIRTFDTSAHSLKAADDARRYLRTSAAKKDAIIVGLAKGGWSTAYYAEGRLMDAQNVDNLLGLTKPIEWAYRVSKSPVKGLGILYSLHNSSYAWISYYDKSLGRRVAVESLALATYPANASPSITLAPYPSDPLPVTRDQLYATLWVTLTQSIIRREGEALSSIGMSIGDRVAMVDAMIEGFVSTNVPQGVVSVDAHFQL